MREAGLTAGPRYILRVAVSAPAPGSSRIHPNTKKPFEYWRWLVTASERSRTVSPLIGTVLVTGSFVTLVKVTRPRPARAHGRGRPARAAVRAGRAGRRTHGPSSVPGASTPARRGGGRSPPLSLAPSAPALS